ncbi:hypothetical protein ASPZODRAFT_148393 [Penicilliopsis zonata CBS 506.65]|uniref:Peptidase S26 domain-containing protein n=1 Tax=Penicilliopsis zonata CBS 506.65 TaxID=1073090 RepID=A0A1L9SUX0_9EURO|nr:hypothetical protein ASPZODRAFT_148393 [Penicilliopsis zonata CBS 506.65]OJJ51022.1 hypothetical protein ASPZODRAFT_148393 [Penicilliopsis zonata CBS 506.65]
MLRSILRRTSPFSIFRFTLDAAGLCCAVTLILEHFYTIQASEGPSMYPTLSTRGDFLLISRLQKCGEGIQVGDIVRFDHPSFLGVHGAKRVLGLPGDFVCRDESLSMEGGSRSMIQIPEGHIFVGGDNMPWSRDSRTYGPLPMGLVNGKIIARVWPPSKMEWIQNTLRPVEI